MTSFNSGFSASARVEGHEVLLSISVLPANSSSWSTRSRDLAVADLVGVHDKRRAVLHESIREMFGEAIADEVCDQAVSAVVAEFNRVGVGYEV